MNVFEIGKRKIILDFEKITFLNKEPGFLEIVCDGNVLIFEKSNEQEEFGDVIFDEYSKWLDKK